MKKILFYITLSFCVLLNYTFAENIEETKIITENNNNNNNNNNNSNNNKPLVSVIMPVYNAEKYLDRSISSVINQTYDNLEILLIDDCSTDNSYNILKEYAKKDKRIKVFHNQENQHVSETRNVGIRNSTGKYLYFIDSDDFIDNDYIEHLVNTAEKENADVVVNPNIYIIKYQKKYNILKNINNQDKSFVNKYIIKKFSTVWYKLYKREIQEKYNIFFDNTIKVGEDGIFNIFFFSKSNNIIFISPNSFYYYNKTNNNSILTLAEYKIFFDNTFNVITKTYHYIKENNLFDKVIGFNLCDLEVALFSKHFNQEKYNKDKQIDYQKVRDFILTIKDDVLSNKKLYLQKEINFINNLEKYKTYNEYKKYYDSNKFIKYIISIIIIIIWSILFIYVLYIFYQIYKDFRKGINPFKNNRVYKKDSQ